MLGTWDAIFGWQATSFSPLNAPVAMSGTCRAALTAAAPSNLDRARQLVDQRCDVSYALAPSGNAIDGATIDYNCFVKSGNRLDCLIPIAAKEPDPKAYVAKSSTASDCFRNPQRPLNLRRGNGSSCPFAAIAENQSPDLSGVESRHSFSRHLLAALARLRRFDLPFRNFRRASH